MYNQFERPITMKQILIIENDAYDAILIEMALDPLQCDVIVQENIERGLAVLQTECPDLILLNIETIRLTDQSDTRQLKYTAHDLNIPIIVMTSGAMNETKPLTVNFEAEITKPIQTHTFLNQIYEHLTVTEAAS